ncbi:hypothetical protein B0H66DRAFT_626436 [Apodospora peruviana]|uniref:F-box domain-containing protein n=1 Tax=Apodospora peruviana TaxID=516989 RepID=A0AAE0M2P1_9PEZI|nr:hypothetical protein B0H66DRAFT_626436 [Apodospora peruviana]
MSESSSQKYNYAAPRAKSCLPRRYADRFFELFDGSQRQLVQLLAVPVLPPRLMRQTLVLLRELERPADQVDNVPIAEALMATRNKRKAEDQAGPALEIDNSHTTTINPPFNFLDLPLDLQREVFEQLDDLSDIICLATTNAYMWSIGQEYAHAFFASTLGAWAGEPIVCVGDGVEPGDYPPNMFTDEDLDEFHQFVIAAKLTPRLSYFTEYNLDPERDFPIMSTAEKYADTTWCDDKGSSILELIRSDEARGTTATVMASMFAQRCLAELHNALISYESMYYPTDQPWVLRNLTKKEFVRADAIDLKPEYINGPMIFGLGFHEVVTAKIMWSSKSTPPTDSDEGPETWTRGEWAGHRLEITALKKHGNEARIAKSCGEEGWKDVSKDTLKEVRAIYDAQYWQDPGWEKMLCETADECLKDVRTRTTPSLSGYFREVWEANDPDLL